MLIERTFSNLSQTEFRNILTQAITFEDALRYMTTDLALRTFAETLGAFYPASGLKQRLLDGLCKIDNAHGGSGSETIARNVRNWLGGKAAPERENLFKICFALGLGESEANVFLATAGDGGFHLRNPRDLAFAFGLRAGKTYAESAALFNGLEPPPVNPKPTAIVFTKTIADTFACVTDEVSFMAFYRENLNALGILHNTAYHKCFAPFMNMLIMPDVPQYFERERKYSVEEVVETYLRMNVPFDRKTSKYALLQRTIRKYWPNAVSITRMRSRAEDVTRKTLLLLYLVTGGHTAREDALSEAEQFESHYWKLNSMLNDCGFSLLDPRNAFDWLVLFCLKADGDELMGERLQGMLNLLFAAETV